jgi:hypothetical protein
MQQVIFMVCMFGGVLATLFIALTLLAIVMGRVKV